MGVLVLMRKRAARQAKPMRRYHREQRMVDRRKGELGKGGCSARMMRGEGWITQWSAQGMPTLWIRVLLQNIHTRSERRENNSARAACKHLKTTRALNRNTPSPLKSCSRS